MSRFYGSLCIYSPPHLVLYAETVPRETSNVFVAFHSVTYEVSAVKVQQSHQTTGRQATLTVIRKKTIQSIKASAGR